MSDDELTLTTQQALDLGLVEDFPGTIDFLVKKSEDASRELRLAISDIYTKSDVSVYWNPAIEKAALYIRPEFDEQEYNLCLSAIREKMGSDNVYDRPLELEDLQDWWVKVAYSPTLRRIGEFLQFFPNSPSDKFGGRPIASTIASGLLGAGLGYGGGALLDKLTPKALKSENGRLKYWGAALGGALGAGAGATPGFINWHEGRKFNDPTLWKGLPSEGFESDILSDRYIESAKKHLAKQTAEAEKEAYQIHPQGISSTLGGPSFAEEPLIRTNELGQVLWGTRASPQTTAMTMGAMYGANQMPDPRSYPGVVTPHQTGLLGMSMGAAGGGLKGYATGYVVGKGLGILTGMPEGTQKALRTSGAALGVINTLVPRLFN